MPTVAQAKNFGDIFARNIINRGVLEDGFGLRESDGDAFEKGAAIDGILEVFFGKENVVFFREVVFVGEGVHIMIIAYIC